MDEIKIGLDFGTHQTKICVQRIPDEGHGEPNYEFFTFRDLNGRNQYFLPSVVQINSDDTLSYGYVDTDKIMQKGAMPQWDEIEIESDFNITDVAEHLYKKYAQNDNVPEDMYILAEMLKVRKKKLEIDEEKRRKEALEQYQSHLKAYEDATNLFRNFKQATFIDGEWNHKIPCKTMCVWYLAYIIFLLEEKYGTDFSINMGVPADDKSFHTKKIMAMEILASAYNLVEDVFKNDKEVFLHATLDELNEKTVFVNYTPSFKEDYFFINVFPEAYASLIGLTSRGKLATGMSLTADMGGGTTDISFFTIQNGLPVIYKYWSIPRGLNYIAKNSGFDYSEGHFGQRVNEEIVNKYNRKKLEIVNLLIKELTQTIAKETSVSVKDLLKALDNRILVYSGGGSTYNFLNTAISSFTDVKVIDASIWREENIKDKLIVSKLSVLLTTAYGLSVCNDDSEVKLMPLTSIFSGLPKKTLKNYNEIDKDVC